MRFESPLTPGKLIQRFKRFLADIELENGKVITVHCPNSGSMKSCDTKGWDVLLSYHDNPKRKYAYTWEMVYNGKCWIGINTGIPNKIAEEAIRADQISELIGYTDIKREVRYGKNSRIDLLLMKDTQNCFVEVKNVTLVEDDGDYYFPDAVTERGRKHLLELSDMIELGHRAVMLFVVQRSDGNRFKPAKHIDPAYSESLQKAHAQGVEILVYAAKVRPDSISIHNQVSWDLD